jgi:DNA primase catalytic subunit
MVHHGFVSKLSLSRFMKPKDRKMLRPGAFQPLERELVFDIDMTDYDPIRSCCRYSMHRGPLELC